MLMLKLLMILLSTYTSLLYVLNTTLFLQPIIMLAASLDVRKNRLYNTMKRLQQLDMP